MAPCAREGFVIIYLWGDAVYAAFDTATDALAAAVEAQRELLRRSWGEVGPLRVRMALHTGTAEVRDGDYVGPTLNRCARLLSAAHGAQILLSATDEEARDKLLETGEAAWVRDRHRDWFLAFAERAERALQGPDQALWLKRLEAEHDNLRAALEWSSADPETGLRLASALWPFWYLRGYVSKEREGTT